MQKALDIDKKEQDISDLEKRAESIKIILSEFETLVEQLESERDSLVNQLLDEKRGADQVNKYLNHSLGPLYSRRLSFKINFTPLELFSEILVYCS